MATNGDMYVCMFGLVDHCRDGRFVVDGMTDELVDHCGMWAASCNCNLVVFVVACNFLYRTDRLLAIVGAQKIAVKMQLFVSRLVLSNLLIVVH